MASTREKRKQEVHFRVMGLLQEDPTISTRKIAQKVGISNGAAYYCVNALVEKGFVKKLHQIRCEKLSLRVNAQGLREKAILTVKFLERKRLSIVT